MSNLSRPPCPRCGFPRMWVMHKRGKLKCPKCKLCVKIDDPRIVLHDLSDLADLRMRIVVSTRGGWPRLGKPATTEVKR